MAHDLAQPGEAALLVRYSWLYLRTSSRDESHALLLPDLGVAVFAPGDDGFGGENQQPRAQFSIVGVR